MTDKTTGTVGNGSENRCMLIFEGLRSDIRRRRVDGEVTRFEKWTSGHPWKSHSTQGLGSCQHTEKTAALS
jgi:hypothetical protein